MKNDVNQPEKNPAAVALGRITSEKKKKQALENLALAHKTRAAPRKLLKDIKCSCASDKQQSLNPDDHLIRCLRGRAIRYRIANEFPLD